MIKIQAVIAVIATAVISVFAQGWVLIWSDEFDYEGLPASEKWGYQTGGGGWGNNESQYYTENRLENARVEDGNLIIEAHRESWGGNQYTSAKLVTRNKGDWTYGRFEIRAILPSGLGTWPAFWMMPTSGIGGWPTCGEIDIMEHVGHDQNRVHGSIHCQAYYHSIGTQKTGNMVVPGASDEFHTYVLEWEEQQMRWYVDGEQYFTFDNENTGHSTWPFYYDFYLILNIAIGGTWGGVVDNGIFPVQMTVDYVRVYGWNDHVSTKVDLHGKDKLTNENLSKFEVNEHNSRLNISYTLSKESSVEVELYTLKGQFVDRWAAGRQQAGNYTISADLKGIKLSCGTYIIRLKEGVNVTNKLLNYMKFNK